MSATKLRGGQTTGDQRLDRLVPTDFRHIEKYPLRALPPSAQPRNVPVVIGINWHRGFLAESLVQRAGRGGRPEYWVAEDAISTPVIGGHAIALEPNYPQDTTGWWEHYDQGDEGACVGFAWSRALSMLYRQRFYPRWLYWEAQRADEWEGGSYEGASPVYEGTSVRAAADVLRAKGHQRLVRGKPKPEDPAFSLTANRWALSVDEVLAALGTPELDHVVWLNSWGRAYYPHRVKVPATVLDKLREAYGELAIPTAR